MEHITINTGDVFDTTGKNFAPEAISAAGASFPGGGIIPGFDAFRVDWGGGDGCGSFCVWRGAEPIALNVACWDPAQAAEAWRKLHKTVQPGLNVSTDPEAPPASIPWLATLILFPARNQTSGDLGWIADFEQCAALFLIEKHTKD